MALNISHTPSNIYFKCKSFLSIKHRNNVIDSTRRILFVTIFIILALSHQITIISNAQVSQNIFDSNQLKTSEVRALLSEGYHNTTESISAAINRLVQRFPNIVESFILGNSVLKNPILGIKISSSRLVPANLAEPRLGIAYLGGINGDHALGHELVLHLAAFLAESYTSNNNSRVTSLIDSTDVFFIPTLNPDGFQMATQGDCHSAKIQSGRNNKNNVDLDQDFKFHNYNDISAVLAHSSKLQPETKAFLDWIVEGGKSVRLFATLRTGLTGITYPYDEIPNQLTEQTYGPPGASTSPNAAPDQLLFEYIGNKIYYRLQEDPTNSTCTPLANNVTVLDGARTGSTYGTLSDFLYRYTNIFPINVYLDCCKYPAKESLESKWLQHANSMFGFLESIKLGLRGTVTDQATGKPIQNARIIVEGLSRSVTSDVDGKYWRPLVPGQWVNLTIEADGYKGSKQPTRSQIMAPNFELLTGQVESNVLNFKLSSASASPASTPSISPQSSAGPSNNVQNGNPLKPAILFTDLNDIISKLDFKTPTELNKHHTYDELVTKLEQLNKRFPKISRLYNIGQSLKGRKLWVIEISDRPGEHQLMKPEFRYIGNMHGNEVVGRELLLHLAKLLLENYGSSDLVTALVNSTRIHLLPSMNPDGYDKSVEGDCESERGRANGNNVDLNRNFPDRFGETDDNKETQPEVQAIMGWSHEYPFVLGANLHGGSLVTNYPFDGNKARKNGVYTASSDDRLFVHLARTYSSNHPTMYKGNHCYDICGEDKTSLLNERFKDGITNGAQWYVLYGGIQDWVYLNTNCLSVTVELGCTKYPLAADMPRYWSDNKRPLIKYIIEIHRGIYGLVTDQNGQALANATIHVKGIDHNVTSASTGDYWRLLLPGDHFVSVSKEGYRTAHRSITVLKNGSPAKRVDFFLSSGPKDLSPNEMDLELDQASKQSAASKDEAKQQFNSILQSSSLASPPTLGASHSPESTNQSLSMESGEPHSTKYTVALYFIFIMPTLMLVVYLFGVFESKKYPSKLGFYRLSTNEDGEVDEDEDEGSRFMKRPGKVSRADQGSDSEDELYSVDSWNK